MNDMINFVWLLVNITIKCGDDNNHILHKLKLTKIKKKINVEEYQDIYKEKNDYT